MYNMLSIIQLDVIVRHTLLLARIHRFKDTGEKPRPWAFDIGLTPWPRA